MNLKQTFIVDASFEFSTKTTGIGLAVHETDKPRRNGILIDQISEGYSGVSSGCGEMLAIYRALEISIERGYEHIIIKTDYNYLKKILKKNHELQTGKDRDDFIGFILRLSSTLKSVSFKYKSKRKNQMAHKLARVGREDSNPILRCDLIENSNSSLIKN